MSATLREVLTLVGRLDDAPGADTPRERFRRFITERVTDVAAARELLAECQSALGDQHARARQDIVVLLGRFLGFDVTFGAYEARVPTRVAGHWRSRRQARIVLDIRSEQTPDVDVDDLARTVAALTAASPADDEERWVGLCVSTPFYAARRRLETMLGQRDARDIRSVTLDSLLWVAGMTSTGRLAHEDVVRLLTSGPDSDFMIDLMRRLTESVAPHESGDRKPPRGVVTAGFDGDDRRAHDVAVNDSAEPVHRVEKAAIAGDGVWAEPVPSPRMEVVSRVESMPATGFWFASLSNDENASPALMLETVIRRRQVLGVREISGLPLAARTGDWVCFHIAGSGIVGHAQLDGVIADATAIIRGARRFTAVFRLQHVAIYDVPNPVSHDSALGRIAARVVGDDAGASLSALSRADYELATMSPADLSRASAI